MNYCKLRRKGCIQINIIANFKITKDNISFQTEYFINLLVSIVLQDLI